MNCITWGAEARPWVESVSYATGDSDGSRIVLTANDRTVNPLLRYSDDLGATWALCTLVGDPLNAPLLIAHNGRAGINSLWIGVDTNFGSTEHNFWTSPDGATWTESLAVADPDNGFVLALISNRVDGAENRFIACTSTGTILVTGDGVTITQPANPNAEARPLMSIAHADGRWVIVGREGVADPSQHGLIFSTDNGVTFNAAPAGFNALDFTSADAKFACAHLDSISRWVVLASTGVVLYSDDFVAWARKDDTTMALHTIPWSGFHNFADDFMRDQRCMLAIGAGYQGDAFNTHAKTVDGLIWTSESVPANPSTFSVSNLISNYSTLSADRKYLSVGLDPATTIPVVTRGVSATCA